MGYEPTGHSTKNPLASKAVIATALLPPSMAQIGILSGSDPSSSWSYDVVAIWLTDAGHQPRRADGLEPDASTRLDGLIALPGAHDVTLLGYAAAKGVPCLWFHPHEPNLPRGIRTVTSMDAQVWHEETLKFAETARPFVGRLVRDLVPRLVQEDGHELTFRALQPEEKPAHIKRKIVEEAERLLGGDATIEVEKIADLLELLETLIRERGVDRERLRHVKDGKKRRRGSFERCFVVEG